MYKISQISKITGISVKALRYYDGEHILTPSYRDQGNQYRYYNDEDLQKALYIRQLRSLDFSIAEIREIVHKIECEEDLQEYLHEKILHIEKQIDDEKALIQQISSFLSDTAPVPRETTHIIELVDVEKVQIASLRFQGTYQDMDTWVPKLYKEVKGHAAGPHFNCYYHEEFQEKADISLCVPVDTFLTTVHCTTLPAIRAVKTVHHGSYDTLYLAYKALYKYVNEQDIVVQLPIRERYVKGPGQIFKGNPDTYVTEILLPFEIKETCE